MAEEGVCQFCHLPLTEHEQRTVQFGGGDAFVQWRCPLEPDMSWMNYREITGT